MRNSYHGTKKLAAWLVLILPGIVTPGCDRPPPILPDVPTEVRILRLVADVDDFAQNPPEIKRIPALFAPDSQPSKEALLRYSTYRYDGKAPVQSGDSATVTVLVKDAKTDQPAGEVQWSMTKINDHWKLTAAPLPAK